ncbi:DUF4190 domain-containing protein [Nocardioides nitrophenolicus]|uniref:DUF4190 domain-containing protein n=1 Tax=Nocardioides nitrophenolicus TaxID=60489 RepID=UPI001958F672|nr:DUF4190 domain-containing protein [Nocardioides nitrophenolicus]MBM7515288.1 putative membrane protein [Nocardioides nitrophenolicus]
MSSNEPPPYGTPPPEGYTPYGGQGGGYGGYGYPQPGYGHQPPAQSGMAIAALVTGISGIVLGCCCGLFGLVGIAGIVCGVMARKDIRESHGAKTGDGLALAGIITGAVAVAFGLLSIALLFVYGGIGVFSELNGDY